MCEAWLNKIDDPARPNSANPRSPVGSPHLPGFNTSLQIFFFVTTGSASGSPIGHNDTDKPHSFLLRLVDRSMDTFIFDRPKKGFGHGIVVTIALPAHARRNLHLFKYLAIGTYGRRVLQHCSSRYTMKAPLKLFLFAHCILPMTMANVFLIPFLDEEHRLCFLKKPSLSSRMTAISENF